MHDFKKEPPDCLNLHPFCGGCNQGTIMTIFAHHTTCLSPDGEESSPHSKPKTLTLSHHEDDPSVAKQMPDSNVNDLIGHSFLMSTDANGEKMQARMTEKVIERTEKIGELEKINFKLDIGQSRAEHIVHYNQLHEHIERA